MYDDNAANQYLFTVVREGGLPLAFFARPNAAYTGFVTLFRVLLETAFRDADDGVLQLWFGPIYLGLLRQLGKQNVEWFENKG